MRNRNLFNRIQELIATNELSAAIQILLNLPLDKKIKEEVVITSSRLEEFNKKERTGLAPKEEELNKIRSSILQILNHFSKAEESEFLSLSTSKMLQKVLIIFDSKDIHWAKKLQLQLEAKNIAVVLDRWNLSIHDDCPTEFEELLNITDSSIVLIGPSGDNPWQNGQVRVALKRLYKLQNENYKVLPILLPNAIRGERSRLPIFLSKAKWLSYGLGGENEELSSILMELQDSKLDAKLSDPSSNICPYRGLEYFDVHHTSHFFGREATTDWLIDALKSNRKQEKNFLAIVGASGSGKSSIARAGL